MSIINVDRVNVANGLKLPVYTSDPLGAVAGDIYYNSSLGRIRVFFNSAWNDIVP